MPGNSLYVIDSSSLINMNMNYPKTVFRSLWVRCDSLIAEGRLCAPLVVLEELEQKDDELTEWARGRNCALFHPDSPYLMGRVSEILRIFPKLINSNLDREQADPFVVAMALEKREGPQQMLFGGGDVYVVTEEKNNRNGNKTKIPEVCDHFGLPCISMVDMMVHEGWEF
jgi:hypothetical protein